MRNSSCKTLNWTKFENIQRIESILPKHFTEELNLQNLIPKSSPSNQSTLFKLSLFMKSELLHVLFYLSLNLKNSILSNHQPSPNRSFLELSSGRLLNLEFYSDNCNICFRSGRLDLALSLLDWLLKYCRLRLIFSCCTVITFDLCEVWPSQLCSAWLRAVDTKYCPSETKNIVDTFTFLIAKTSSSLLAACFILPQDINFAASTTIHKPGILRCGF